MTAAPSRIVLATARDYPLTPSDALLRDELAARGADVTAVPWDRIPPADRALVVLRSTWDYHRRPDEFRRWVAEFDDGTARLLNPPATVLWNMDKVYLRELAERGVRVPATRWYEPGERPDVAGFLADTGAALAVAKPRISATAWGTRIVRVGEELSCTDLAPLLSAGAMLQAFVPEIRTFGELSLVYFDDRFSHAFVKRAVQGDFRVQVEFGGSEEPVTPSGAARSFAESVLDAAGRPWLYARVDVVESADGLVLMELELIEPALSLELAPGAAARFAAALLSLDGAR